MAIKVTVVVPNLGSVFIAGKEVETLDDAAQAAKDLTSGFSEEVRKAAVFLIGDVNVDVFAKLIADNIYKTV